MVYVPAEVPEPEAAGSDADTDEPPARPVDPDAVEEADIDDLREQVAALTRTVEYLIARDDEREPSREFIAAVVDEVVNPEGVNVAGDVDVGDASAFNPRGFQ